VDGESSVPATNVAEMLSSSAIQTRVGVIFYFLE
jgi:hypothetical protein